MTNTEITSTDDQITWKAPGWATGHEDRDGGMAYTYLAPTVPVIEAEMTDRDPEPLPVQAFATDYMSVVDGRVTISRDMPVVHVGGMVMRYPEASKLHQALGEVIEVLRRAGQDGDL